MLFEVNERESLSSGHETIRPLKTNPALGWNRYQDANPVPTSHCTIGASSLLKYGVLIDGGRKCFI